MVIYLNETGHKFHGQCELPVIQSVDEAITEYSWKQVKDSCCITYGIQTHVQNFVKDATFNLAKTKKCNRKIYVTSRKKHIYIYQATCIG